MEESFSDRAHAERLTEREQTLLFARWEDQRGRDLAAQSEPTVGDIAEAYGMPPAEVHRQLAALRAEQAEADAQVRARGLARVAAARRTAAFALIFGILGFIIWHAAHAPGSGMAAAHKSRGDKFYEVGRYSDAEGEYVLAVQEEPNIAMYHNSLGTALDEQKKYAEALPQFQKAVQLMPDRLIYQENLGSDFLVLRRFEDARRTYQAAVTLDPGSAESYTGLGDSLRGLSQNAEAERAYRTALSHSPGDPNLLDAIGVAVGDQGRVAEAAGYFRQAVAAAPDNPRFQRNLRQAEGVLAKARTN